MATVDAVKDLHTSMIDTRKAYEKACEEAQDADLKALFEDMVTMRRDHHEQLHRVLLEMGEKPSEDGSFMTTVHRAAIGVRSAVTGIDHSALSAFASGEERLLKGYDEALEQSDIRPDTVDLLNRQRVMVEDRIVRMKAEAGRAAG